MLTPHQTKRIETGEVREGFLLSREVNETKPFKCESREHALFSEKVMLLKPNGLFFEAGRERGRKKGGPKMKVYPVMLMKTQDRFSTASPQSRQV
jgi:hypothetical protein